MTNYYYEPLICCYRCISAVAVGEAKQCNVITNSISRIAASQDANRVAFDDVNKHLSCLTSERRAFVRSNVTSLIARALAEMRFNGDVSACLGRPEVFLKQVR